MKQLEIFTQMMLVKIADHTSILQNHIRDIMITDGNWTNGSNATIQKNFPASKGWCVASYEAAEWLSIELKKRKIIENIYFFIFDSVAQDNNRITKYRGLLNRPFVKKIIDGNCKVISQGVYESSQGLFFWGLLLVSTNTLREIIEYVRIERKSFLFLSDDESNLRKIGNFMSRGSEIEVNKFVNIDRQNFICFLLKININPIRVWGVPGEWDMWIEIYGEIK